MCLSSCVTVPLSAISNLIADNQSFFDIEAELLSLSNPNPLLEDSSHSGSEERNVRCHRVEY